MSKTHFLKNLAEELSDAIPSHLHTLKKDFSKTCRVILEQAFNKIDIVTREEFDTQTKVLIRTRKKVEELQDHLSALEKLIDNKHREK